MKYKKQNKKAVSLMISYVLLISIVLALSIGVFSWLKIMVNVEPTIDCKDDTSLVILDYKCNPSPETSEPFTTKNLELNLKNNGRFNIDGVIVTVSPTDSTPTNYLAPDKIGGQMNGHYYFPTPLEPQQEKTISFINNNYTEGTLKPMNFNNIEKIELQPFIITGGDKFERIVCQNAVKRISIPTNEDCTIIGDVVIPPEPDPEQPTPIAYWNFDNDNYETEIGGYEWSAIQEVSLVNDAQFGKVVSFNPNDGDPTDDNGHLKITPTIPSTNNFDLLAIEDKTITISALIQTTSVSSTKQGIIKRGNNGGSDGDQEYALYLEGGIVSLIFSDEDNDNANNNNNKIQGTTSVNDGDWHLITGVLRPNNRMEIYVDGNQENFGTRTEKTPPTPSILSLQTLGTLKTNRFFFTGQIDEVKIWQEALTAEQIQTEYQNYNL
jgi:hypothetical protein